MLPSALALLAGSVAGFLFQFKYPLPIILTAVALGFLTKEKTRWFFILSALFMIGESLSANRLSQLNKTSFVPYQYMDIYGKLLRNPEYSEERTRLLLSTSQGKVILTVKGQLRGYFKGDRIFTSLMPYSWKHPCNFHVENYFRLYRNISFFASSKSTLFFRKRGTEPLFAALRPLYKLKEKASLKASSLPSPYSGIISALVLGQRYPMGERAAQALQRAGIYHLMAISGAHIALFSIFVWWISGLFTYKRKLRLWLTAAGLLLFYLWVEPSPSVNRATLMAFLVILGKILERDISLLNIISLSFFISLLSNPLAFLSPGFQLTYFVSLGLILFIPFLKNLPFLLKTFSFSSVAFFFSLPISLYHFHKANLLSPLLNLIGAGLVPFIILLATFGLLGPSFMLCPSRLLIDILLSMERVSFALVTVPSLPLALVLSAGIILVLSRKKPLLLASVLLLLLYPSRKTRSFEVLFLDVGQGDSVLVKCPPSAFLYDGGGGRHRGYVGEFITSKVLWAEGLKSLDAVFASHFHPDHAEGLVAVARNFKVNKLFYSKRAQSPLFYRLTSLVKKSLPIKRGDILKIGSCTVKVLWPPPLPPGPAKNSDSLVLLVESAGQSLLLTGDIGEKEESEILSDLKTVKVLKVAHHGSRKSSSPDFLKRLRPVYSVISCGENNPYGFPHPEALKRLRLFSRRVFSTSLCGAVRIRGKGAQTCLPCPSW